MKFTVVRQHFGDKMYMPGDTREAVESDVRHLLDNGVLRKDKAEPAHSNKAEKAPKNKGA